MDHTPIDPISTILWLIGALVVLAFVANIRRRR